MPATPSTTTSTVPGLDPEFFTTDDPEQAHAFIRRAYVDNTMRITGSRKGFRMEHTHRHAGPYSSAIMTHTMAVEHVARPLGRLMIGRVLAGRIERETAGETLSAVPGDVFLVAPPDRPCTARWDSVRLQIVTIDQSVLTDVADGSAGRRTGPPRFTGYRAVSTTAARQCASVLDFVTSQLDSEAMASPILVASAARMLGASLLTTFPNTGLADEPGGEPAVSPATLRRAMEFVETGAHLPIGLTEIAEAARVAPRTLQLLFRRSLDTTPTSYLRRVRLDRAHQDLLAADPARGDTVTAIAVRWGFHHQGRFAAFYRETYGRSPRRTLIGYSPPRATPRAQTTSGT